MAICATHHFKKWTVHIPKMVRFVQILGNMDHLLNTIFRTKIVLVIAVRDDDSS